MGNLYRALACVTAFSAAMASTPVLAAGPYAGEQKPTWMVTYSGFDFAQDSNYFYSGVLVSLNRDLSRSGFVFSAFGGYASYEYDTTSVPGGVVDGDGKQYEAMLGYMFVRDGGALAIYVGVDHQNHDLTPFDPDNVVEGSETGFKTAADLTHESARFYLSLMGNYSTAFDTYWTRARVGLKFDRWTVGPEGLALGNDGFDAQRVGAFVRTNLNLTPQFAPELIVSGGYQFADDDDDGTNGVGSGGGSGGYGALNLSFAY